VRTHGALQQQQKVQVSTVADDPAQATNVRDTKVYLLRRCATPALWAGVVKLAIVTARVSGARAIQGVMRSCVRRDCLVRAI